MTQNKIPGADDTALGAEGEESHHHSNPAPAEQPTHPRSAEHAAEAARLRKAYKQMADEARYRPAAPGDGCGLVLLTPKQLRDRERLEREAAEYAEQFLKEENSLSFWIGCSDFATNRALVWTIEAARCLCGGADKVANKLLEMATEEVRRVRHERKRGRA